jgi:Tfp pilus assembly protein PilO
VTRAESFIIIDDFNLKLTYLARQASTVTLTPLQTQLVTEVANQAAQLLQQALAGTPIITDLLAILVNVASTLISTTTTR